MRPRRVGMIVQYCPGHLSLPLHGLLPTRVAGTAAGAPGTPGAAGVGQAGVACFYVLAQLATCRRTAQPRPYRPASFLAERYPSVHFPSHDLLIKKNEIPLSAYLSARHSKKKEEENSRATTRLNAGGIARGAVRVRARRVFY